MKSLHERGEILFMRTEFAERFCACVQSPIVLMAFFDTRTRSFSQSWVGRSEACGDETGRKMIEVAEARLAVWAAINSKNQIGDEIIPDSQTADTIWMNLGELTLGIAPPVGGHHPVMVFPNTTDQEAPHHKTMLLMGMSFISHQLTQELYTRSTWMEALAESALQVLSIQFLVVTQDGKVCFDSLQNQSCQTGNTDWVMYSKIIELITSTRGNSELKDAVSTAILSKRKNSIVSVFASPGLARLVAVTPLKTEHSTMALILFESENTDHAKLRKHFFNAYSLTPSECLVTQDILSGKSIANSAEANNLSQATVRSYMKQVFAKTGTHRQSELISKYFQSILPVTIDLKAHSKVSSPPYAHNSQNSH